MRSAIGNHIKMGILKNISVISLCLISYFIASFASPKNVESGNYKVIINDTLSPLEIAQKFMSNDSFPDVKNYLCCEMFPDTTMYSNIPKEKLPEFKKTWELMYPDFTEKTFGQNIPKEIKRTFEILQMDSSFAVISVTIYSQKPHNIYLNFVKNNNWNLSSIRDLARSTMMHSPLATSSDSVLSAYFIEHKNDFESLLQKFNNGPESKEVIKIKKKLELAVVEKATEISAHSVRFIIGGMLSDTFGVLFIDNDKLCPRIDGENYIMIKKITQNWYIFKTT